MHKYYNFSALFSGIHLAGIEMVVFRKILILPVFFLFAVVVIQPVAAQENKQQEEGTLPQDSQAANIAEAEKTVSKQSDNNFTKEFEKGPPKPVRQYIYEEPNLENFAFLHWAMNIVDDKTDENIDIFLKLTECQLYQNYNSDEFEWAKIREATKEYIQKNKLDFPSRFELVIPLKMGDYDTERSFFELQEESKIKGVRMFEIVAKDANKRTYCLDGSRYIGNYYRSFVLEMSRPFTLNIVPVEAKAAKELIESTNKIYMDIMKQAPDSAKVFNKDKLLDMRNAYLVMYIKAFAYKGLYTGSRNADDYSRGVLLSVLEGYEIFGDPYRRQLFYSRNYVSKRNVEKENENLGKEITILKKRHEGKGILFEEG